MAVLPRGLRPPASERLLSSLFLVFVLSLAVGTARGQTVDPVTAVEVLDPEDEDQGSSSDTPEIRAVAPAFTITNFFLEVVIRPPALSDLGDKLDLSSVDAFVTSAESDWEEILKHYYCYVICLALAVVYVLTMWIAGCCICCCRKRGRCGGKQSPVDGKHTRHHRRFCSLLLGVLLILILAGNVVMYLSNELVHDQTAATLNDTLDDSLTRFDGFKGVAHDAYSNYFQTDFRMEMEQVSERARQIPEAVRSQVLEATDNEGALDVVISYVSRLNVTAETLAAMDTLVASVTAKSQEYKSVREELVTNLTADFKSACTTNDDACDLVINATSDLTPVSDFQGLPPLAPYAAEISALLSGDANVYEGLSKTYQDLNKIQETVANMSAGNISKLVAEFQKVSVEANNFIGDALAVLDTVTFGPVRNTIATEISPKLQEYGDYRYYGAIALSAIVTLITTMCFFALLCGCCGARAGSGSGRWDKGTASYLLKFALGLIFVLSWILMIVTAVFLPLGGISHNDLCRSLLLPEDAANARLLDNLIKTELKIDFSVYDLFRNCEQEQTIFRALGMEEKGIQLNISDIFHPDKYDVPGILAAIQVMRYDPGDVLLVNDDLEKNLNISASTLNSVDISRYQQQLNLPQATMQDLNNLTTVLDTLATTRNDSVADLANSYLTKVNSIVGSELQRFVSAVASLEESVSDITRLTSNNSVLTATSQLKSGQALVTPEALSSAVVAVCRQMQDDFVEFLLTVLAALRDDVSPCAPLASAVRDFLEGVCVDFLYPFNSFWCSMGWCLFFFLWLVPLNIKLADYYSKKAPYTGRLSSLEAPRRMPESRETSESGIVDDDVDGARLPIPLGGGGRRNQRSEESPYFMYSPSLDGSIDGDHPEETYHRNRRAANNNNVSNHAAIVHNGGGGDSGRHAERSYPAPSPWTVDGYQAPSYASSHVSPPASESRYQDTSPPPAYDRQEWDNIAYEPDNDQRHRTPAVSDPWDYSQESRETPEPPLSPPLGHVRDNGYIMNDANRENFSGLQQYLGFHY